MISELEGSEPKKQEAGHLISELRNLLSSKRYMFILDDVWNIDLWEQLKHSLPDDKNGSRVVMTSRFIDVAKSADPKMIPYELTFLKEKESLDLLLKKALPYQEPDEECPIDLLELADKLSKKCKGLPLALIVLGGILSTKNQTCHDWKKVLDTMDWHEEGKDCMQVLAMSYEDMPFYLKACFLYLSSFPENFEIYAIRLINMWVAERIIPQQEKKTMEETAEVCLDQLIQRSLVQVSSRNTDGSIKRCRVHDLVRDLAMHEGIKENFISVFSEPQGRVNYLHRNLETLDLRRTGLDGDILMGVWTISTLRHVICDEDLVCGPPSNVDLSNLQTLQCIVVSDTWKTYLPCLKNLRKFGLVNRHANNWDGVVHLLGTLAHLLVLSVRITEEVQYIPIEIVYPTMIPNYQNLQSLSLWNCWSEDVTLEARLLPPHLVKLILADSQLRQDPMQELGKLKNLKKLELWEKVYIGGTEMICPAGFPALEKLFIYLTGITSFTVKEGVMPKLKHIENGSVRILNMPPELKHFEK
ncbi:hypothetical protein LUZ61_014566 [Rhynchospora tenuis]|uniref:NB-ARC domain-containing protein n=1 Tax=Rhynchospora tenuis TaxID=198213 RepID=A0AAD5Z2N8_9POAL|nr:hypothetical protein LUZ61_014566 [Rhynchospora tenuis]